MENHYSRVDDVVITFPDIEEKYMRNHAALIWELAAEKAGV